MHSYREPPVITGERSSNRNLPQESAPGSGPERRLDIAVIVTSFERTIAAISRAVGLLRGLDGCISLIEAQPIPYPLPLVSPPVSLEFTRRRLLALANESTVEIKANVYLCRFRFETIAEILEPGSTVVIGCRHRWHGWEKKLARKLRRARRDLVVIEA
jgi:hypothetical protein